MQPKFAKALALLAAAWVSAPLAPAFALPLVNGDFADPLDLAGWTATGSAVGEPTGDFAQLATDGLDFQRTLEQTFTLPTTPATLAFDFAFSTEGVLPVAGFPDSFAVSLVTAGGDFLDLLVVDLLGALADPSDGLEWLTGALPIAVDLDPTVTLPGFVGLAGGTGFSGRVSLLLPAAVLGEEATLYFDLFDQPDGAATRAALDNVALAPAGAVPLPATLGLLLAGLAATAATRRR